MCMKRVCVYIYIDTYAYIHCIHIDLCMCVCTMYIYIHTYTNIRQTYTAIYTDGMCVRFCAGNARTLDKSEGMEELQGEAWCTL